jgi:hypothetical protein
MVEAQYNPVKTRPKGGAKLRGASNNNNNNSRNCNNIEK